MKGFWLKVITGVIALLSVTLIVLPGFVSPLAVSADDTIPVEQPAAVPTVTTDKQDYAPGSDAYITITGFLPGETVHVYAIGTPNGLEFAGDLPIGPDGSVYGMLTLPPNQDEVYVMTVTGLTSGRVATTTFTDAAPAKVTFSSSGLPSVLLSL